MTTTKIFLYEQPLCQPLNLAGRVHTARQGLLIKREGRFGVEWGEAAPLPGFSRESLEDVVRAARSGDWTRYPSLQLASSAILSSRTLATRPIKVPVNGLLMGAWDEMASAREKIVSLPYPALKFKVGRPGRLDDEIHFVRDLVAMMSVDQQLRLDANRKWTFIEAMRFAQNVPTDRIEYIEEPTNRSSEFERLYESTGLSYALDETLIGRPRQQDYPNCQALVIKPTILGASFESLLKWNLPITFSAAFESGVGISHIARLAASLAPTVPCGLDTYRWVKDDLVHDGLSMSPGVCQVGPQLGIDGTRLTEIAR